ncbi:hypothetical protein KSP40_PGU000766 [Platanthera guangdongensis]|uniref:Transposase (putative) gypsy type domain-containing protein n=1 Tax=Platanthera guangdongensis TaxID=2320717 RepID=A0ABR2LPQ8_9ASPA
MVEIFEHYGMVLGQLAPNTLAAIYSFLSYLRSEKIAFSLNIFRKIFSARSITPFGGRPYKGVIYFYCRGRKVTGLHNKIHNWTSRFLIFEVQPRVCSNQSAGARGLRLQECPARCSGACHCLVPCWSQAGHRALQRTCWRDWVT